MAYNYPRPAGPQMRQEMHQWLPASNGQVPPGAIELGRGAKGEPMYVGRGPIDGDIVPGKIVPLYKCIFVGCNTQEKSLPNYEALVVDPSRFQVEWVRAQNGQVPPGAVEGGRVSSTGEPLFVGRGHPPNEAKNFHGGKVHPSHGCLYVPYCGKEHAIKDYEVLCVRSLQGY